MRRIAEFFRNNKKWNIALWVSIMVFLVLSMLAVNTKENNLRVKRVEISIEPKEDLAFLDSPRIIEIIKGMDTNRALVSARKTDIKLDVMESDLEKNPFIEKADISMDLSGKLIVKVLQRNPVLRVVNQQGQGYYVAKSGFKMPISPDFAPRVLIANGNITETLVDTAYARTKVLKDLLAIAAYCAADNFWHSQIEQLYVDNFMDIILVPKVGNHSIVFGSAEDLEFKFGQLKTFYLKGLNSIGWDKYKSINLKYKGQIIGEKKINTEITAPITQQQNQH
jgi:cell division protein FtsQ